MTGAVKLAPAAPPSIPAQERVVYSSQPNVRFLSRGVQPPSPVYVDTSDVLQVGCATSQLNEVVTISYRLLRADGQLIKGQFQVNPPNTRAIAIKTEQLAEGFLLSVSCKAAVATTRGQTFVRVFLTDPALGGGQPSYMLMADYVTTAMAPAFPNGRVLAPVEGPGFVTGRNTTAPGPGLEWSLLVPTNTRWRIIDLEILFTTAAGGANRYVNLAFPSSPVTASFSLAEIAHAPATTIAYNASLAGPYITPNPTRGFIPLPQSHITPGGLTIQTSTDNIQAGDTYGGALVGVEEWLDNV